MNEYIAQNYGIYRHIDGWTPFHLNNLKGNIKYLSVREERFTRGFKERTQEEGLNFSLDFDHQKKIIRTQDGGVISEYFDYSRCMKSKTIIRGKVFLSWEYGSRGEVLSWCDGDDKGSHCVYNEDESIFFEERHAKVYLQKNLVKIESGSLIHEIRADGEIDTWITHEKGSISSMFVFKGPLKAEQIHYKNDKINYRWKYEYDPQGRKIKTLQYRTYDFFPEWEYEYSRHENPIFRYEGSKENAYTTFENHLNKNGDIEKSIGTRRHNGKVIYKETNKYVYDSTGNWVERVSTVIQQGCRSRYNIYYRDIEYY